MKILAITLFGVAVLGVLSTTPAIAQVTADDVKCDGCVQSTDIATNGVRRTNIQNFAVNTPKLNNFAVTKEKIKSGAVTETKIAPEAVTTAKIANGAVTVEKLSPELSNTLDELQETLFSLDAANRLRGTESAIGDLVGLLGLTCNLTGRYVEIEACSELLTADGRTVQKGSLVISRLIYLTDPNLGPSGSSILFAMVGGGLQNWAAPTYGRQANFTRDYRVHGFAYVDDCSAPTVLLVEEGKPGTGGFGLDNGHVYIVNRTLHPLTEDGQWGNPLGQRTLAGESIGRINHVMYQSSLPLCEMVSVDGVFDEYAIVFQADTSTWNPLTAN